MAIDIKKFNENVNRFLIALPRNVQRINKTLALSAIPLIKKRLIDKGVTGEGRSLGKYSERPLSPSMLIPQALGTGADRKIQAEIKKQQKAGLPVGISYKKFREINNRPTDHVTLSFTGETLNDISITQQVIFGSSAITTIESKNSKTKKVYNKKGKQTGSVGTGDVLERLGERYGDILSLTPQEEKEISEAFNDELQALIDQYL